MNRLGKKYLIIMTMSQLILSHVPALAESALGPESEFGKTVDQINRCYESSEKDPYAWIFPSYSLFGEALIFLPDRWQIPMPLTATQRDFVKHFRIGILNEPIYLGFMGIKGVTRTEPTQFGYWLIPGLNKNKFLQNYPSFFFPISRGENEVKAIQAATERIQGAKTFALAIAGMKDGKFQLNLPLVNVGLVGKRVDGQSIEKLLDGTAPNWNNNMEQFKSIFDLMPNGLGEKLSTFYSQLFPFHWYPYNLSLTGNDLKSRVDLVSFGRVQPTPLAIAAFLRSMVNRVRLLPAYLYVQFKQLELEVDKLELDTNNSIYQANHPRTIQEDQLFLGLQENMLKNLKKQNDSIPYDRWAEIAKLSDFLHSNHPCYPVLKDGGLSEKELTSIVENLISLNERRKLLKNRLEKITKSYYQRFNEAKN